MSELTHDGRESLDVVWDTREQASERVQNAKNRIAAALTDEDLESAISDLRDALAERRMWNRVHTDFWQALGEPRPRTSAICVDDAACGNCCSTSCTCF